MKSAFRTTFRFGIGMVFLITCGIILFLAIPIIGSPIANYLCLALFFGFVAYVAIAEVIDESRDEEK